MATATKTLRTLVSSTPNSAGSSSPSTLGTGSVDLTTKFGGLLTGKITNGTGLTVGCTMNVYTSGDGTNWKLFTGVTAPTTTGLVSEFSFEIPAGAMYVAVQFGGNTGASATVEAFLQELTSIG